MVHCNECGREGEPHPTDTNRCVYCFSTAIVPVEQPAAEPESKPADEPKKKRPATKSV